MGETPKVDAQAPAGAPQMAGVGRERRCVLSQQEHGGFITMPLCWLSAQLPWRDLMQRALGYGFYHYLLQTHDSPHEIQADPDAAENEVRRVIGISGGSLSVWEREHREISKFEREFTSAGLSTYHPRLDTSLVFEARDDGGISENEMRVHIALVSALGAKGYMRLGWKPIQWRAAGFLTQPDEPAGEHMLSRGQIDRAAHGLIARGLWRCYSYGSGRHPGERYWTNRQHISLEKLVELVHQAKAKRNAYAEQQRKAAEYAATLSSNGALLTCAAPAPGGES
jgi:hypothetical protein